MKNDENYNRIHEVFSKEIFAMKEIENSLLNLKIKKLPNNTIGNNEVYIVNIYGDANINIKEVGYLFLFPGSGIKVHPHPFEKGISEKYSSIGKNKFHFYGIEYDIYECELGESHGIDIEDTPRIVYYEKTNELLQKQSINNNKKNRVLKNTRPI